MIIHLISLFVFFLTFLVEKYSCTTLLGNEISNINNCEVVSLDKETRTRCLRCSENYILSTDQYQCHDLFSISSENYASLTNCIQLGIFNECIACDCGFSTDMQGSSTCVRTPLPELYGCQIFDGNTCLKPKQEFQIVILQSKRSSSPVDKYIEYSFGTNCEIKHNSGCYRCHHGYKLTSLNTCVRVPGDIVNSYYSYFEGDTLRSHDIRFISMNEKGVFLRIDNCLDYAYDEDSKSIKCVTCKKGKVLNESATKCYVSPIELCNQVLDDDPQKCTTCVDKQNYYLLEIFGKGAKCVPRTTRGIYDGCIEYHRYLNQCIKCRYPFVLINFKCEMSQEKEPNHGTKAVISNCLIFNERFFETSFRGCLECDIGFTLTNAGTCEIEFDENCLVLLYGSNSCIQCKLGYLYSNLDKRCKENNQQVCLEYDIINAMCVVCVSGFYVDYVSKSCVEIKLCLNSDGVNEQCDVCQNLHFPRIEDDNTRPCVPIDRMVGCYLSDGITNMCLVCQRYYVKRSIQEKWIESAIKNQEDFCVPVVLHNGKSCVVHGFYIVSENEAYCKAHSHHVKRDCYLLDSKSDRCLRCISGYYMRDANEGVCRYVYQCELTDGISKKCYKATYTNGAVDSQGKVIEDWLICNTNRRDSICVNKRNDTSAVIRNLDGAILIDFDEQIIESVPAAQFCFVLLETQIIKDKVSYECEQCMNLFYVQDGLCVRLVDSNCKLSDGKSPNCLLCVEGYEIVVVDSETGIGTCVVIILDIDRCVERKGSLCSRCESLFIPTLMQNTCTAVRNPACSKTDGVVDQCSCTSLSSKCNFDFCSVVEKKNPICISCIPGYSLIRNMFNGDLCINEEQASCVEIDGERKICKKCKPGYFKNSRMFDYVCVKSSKFHCKHTEDFTFKCLECEEGYALSLKGNCYQSIHCIRFEKQQCVQCEAPFVVNSQGMCELVRFCVQVKGSNCVKCESSYYLSESKNECLPVRNCASSFGRDNLCEICLSSFKLITFTCIPILPIDNCVEYQESECVKCLPLYFLSLSANGVSECSQITHTQFCNESDGIHNQCKQCDTSGYVLTHTSSKKELISCKYIENCIITNGVDTCFFCSKYFYLRKNESLATGSFNRFTDTCVARRQILNCKYYDSSESACETCENLFYLSIDRQSCIQFSETLSDSCFVSDGQHNECLICNFTSRKYSYINGMKVIVKSLNDHYITRIQICNSRTENIDYFLTGCSQNYYEIRSSNPTYNKCVPRTFSPSIDNCEIYFKNSNSCRICKQGFILNTKETNPYGNFCESIKTDAIVPNCSQYFANSADCEKCEQNEQLDIIEFVLDSVQNKCVNIISEQCSRTTYEGKLTISQSNKPLCPMKHIPFCEQLKEPIIDCKGCQQEHLRCLKCKNGFYINQSHSDSSGECLKHPYFHECLVYNSFYRFECTQCNIGYWVFDSTCEEGPDKFCNMGLKYQYDCQDCKQGYAIVNYTQMCQKVDFPNCQQASEFNCTSCRKGFSFNLNKECVRKSVPDPNCVFFEKQQSFEGDSVAEGRSKRKCEKCADGYLLTENNECIKIINSICRIKACSIYDKTSSADFLKCSSCIEGFEVNSEYKCVLKIEKVSDSSNPDETEIQGETKKPENEKNWLDSVIVIVLSASVTLLIAVLFIAGWKCYRKKQFQDACEKSETLGILSQTNSTTSDPVLEMEIV